MVFVNTAYSCLATLSERYSFTPLWQPSFISRLAPEDRCHLNGLALADGRPAYVTAVSRSDVAAGWRETLAGVRERVVLVPRLVPEDYFHLLAGASVVLETRSTSAVRTPSTTRSRRACPW